MLRAYKYRLYPTADQIIRIEKTFGVCRLIYNACLETKIYAWQAARKNLSAIDLCYQLVDVKQAYPWVAEIDSQALQASVKKIDRAFQQFFSGKGFPKFKKKSGPQSFQCPNNTRRIDWINQTLTLPKIPDIPVRLSRSFEGTIKTVTISRTPTRKYYASILVDNKQELPAKPQVRPETTIGIDLGINSFAVTSDGRFFEPNRFLKKSLKRLQCLQRRASRKKKGSQNRKKANLRVARKYEKITRQRVDYCHKITTGLIRDSQAQTWVVEDLAIANMVKNRNLAQALSDTSMGEFLRQVEYKCAWYGKNLVRIGRFEPSTKTCSVCGSVREGLRLRDREWGCPVCGTWHDRDLNAARNIRKMGLKKFGGAGCSYEPGESRRLRWAMNQEKVQG